MNAYASYMGLRPGQVYLCTIPFGTGREMVKDRPAVVVSKEEFNASHPTVWVAMCSASDHEGRKGCVEVSGLERRSWALCDQLYTVDKSRLVQYICDIGEDELRDISRCVKDFLPYSAVSPAPVAEESRGTSLVLLRAETERDTYKAMYEGLLGKVLRGGVLTHEKAA